VLATSLVLALGAGVTLWRASVREAVAVANYPPQGQFMEVTGEQVHVLDLGQPAGWSSDAPAPDLVLIHGASGHIRDMSFRLAPALRDRYRIVIVDRPGLGYSSRADHTGASLAEQARLIRGAVAQLDVRAPIVLGQSYGGGVALAWALDAPGSISALVTVGGVSHPWPTPLSRFYKITSSPLGQALVVPLLTAFVPRQTIRDTLTEVFEPQPVPEGYFDHFGPGLTLRRSAMRANALQRANLLAEITAMAPRYPALRLRSRPSTAARTQLSALICTPGNWNAMRRRSTSRCWMGLAICPIRSRPTPSPPRSTVPQSGQQRRHVFVKTIHISRQSPI
jgi:pimeloyl-ACP methyl ester carboxylesterase